MASRSSLRKRLSLVWIAKTGIGFNDTSPLFFLCNSNWNLQISFGLRHYSIFLKCCNSVKSIPPFEVVTYLEERRGNAQMYCSKLTVSSTRETLFDGKCDVTYEKLPSLETYKDVTVVCTFYPSSVLSLKKDGEKDESKFSIFGSGEHIIVWRRKMNLVGTVMRGGVLVWGSMTTSGIVSSCLRIRPSLVWETGKPSTVKTESSVFGLQESGWKLLMYSENSTQSTSPVCKIYLINSKGIAPSEPFEVKTFLEDKRSDDHIGCSKLIVSSSCENLYKASIDDIYKKLPGLKLYDDMRVVCIFDSFTESTLIV